MMTQAQKTRWLKTGALIFFFLVAIYYIAPSGVDVYRGCKDTAHTILPPLRAHLVLIYFVFPISILLYRRPSPLRLIIRYRQVYTVLL